MSNHFLSEAYKDMSAAAPATQLLTEAPNQEQVWLERHLIKPITQLIANLHMARSYVNGQLEREKVLENAQKLEAIKNNFLELWHNIEDNKGPDEEPAESPEVVDVDRMLKRLRAIPNPSFKGTKRQVKFSTPEAVKQFLTFAKVHGLNATNVGNIVQYDHPKA